MKAASLSLPRPHPLGVRGSVLMVMRPLVSVLGLLALGLFFARAPIELCLAVVLGAVLGCAILLRPVWALYLLAFSVPFGSLYEVHWGDITIGVSQLLVLALAIAWLARMMAFRCVRLARTRLMGALLGYLGALVVGLWPARNLTLAFKELAKWVEFLLIYLFVAGELDESQLQALIGALLVAGSLEGLLGIYQFLRQMGPSGFVLLGRYMRAYGTFQQPNPFGGYMGLLLPLAYTTVIARWRAVCDALRGRNLGSVVLWFLSILASAVMFVALVMSWSRGALLGFVVGLACVGLGLGRRVVPVALGLALALIFLGPVWLAILPPALVERVADAAQYVGQDLTTVEVTDENFALVERAAHWYAAWRMFEQRPWLGMGTGQYAEVYPSVALPRWQDPLGHAHNYYLNVLAEGGLVGLGIYLLFLFLAFGIAWNAVGRELDWRRGLALAALGMLGHLVTHSLFDNLYVHEMYLLVAMFLGMVAALTGEGHLASRRHCPHIGQLHV